MHFSVLIPTYNRAVDLLACIGSIASQSEQPAQCIIIDDGELTNDDLAAARERLGPIALTYHKKNHAREARGQSESKIIGLNLASHDVVFILDDDVVLEPDFFSAIMAVWTGADDDRLMGVGGMVSNARRRPWGEKLYNAVFLLSSPHAWDVTPVGFQVWDETIGQRQKSYYVNGGLCSIHRTRAQRFPFNTFKAGRSALEDVDFCLRAKLAGYFFYMEPRARALHNTSPLSRESVFRFGIKESVNRSEIYRNNAPKSIAHWAWYWWSSIGWVLRQILAGNLRKGAGLLVGLFQK
jgi:GT2 family glycosyltransferase